MNMNGLNLIFSLNAFQKALNKRIFGLSTQIHFWTLKTLL